jgi:transposase
LALVVLSMVEHRLDAVRAVLAGADVTKVAAGIGVHRSTAHRWVGRYLSEQLVGLVDRSHRPLSSPAEVADAVEVAVAEMRRGHPRWGARRIRLEMLRQAGPWFRGDDLAVPSERTIGSCAHVSQVLARERTAVAVEANPRAISQMPNVSSNNPPGIAPTSPAPATPNSSSSVPPAKHA